MSRYEKIARKYLSRMGSGPWIDREWSVLAKVIEDAVEEAITAEEPCGSCGGSGVYDDMGSPSCGSCHGTGVTRVVDTYR